MEQNLGTLNDLIDYFNLNKQIFQKEKNNMQHMERVMAMLTQENMRILQKQFQLYTKGLELPTFIYLMKKLYVPENQISKFYFVSDLIKFFQAIDVNGDGHLQWSQFTEYIIENIRRVEKPNYKNKTFQQNQIISSAYSKISNQYKITKIIDSGANNCIKKVVYVNKQQKYYVLQAAVNIIKIYDSNFKEIDCIIMKSENQTSYIVDFAFDKENQVFCALFQGSAKFINMKVSGNNIKFVNQVEQKKLKNYHKVQYLPQHELWAFLSKTGQIKYSQISYRSRTQMQYKPIITLKQHDALITDIIQIQEPKYIISSSMDGSMKLYSVLLKRSVIFQHISEQTHSVINSKNKKGILGIDYTRQFGSYVLSYGFSTSIYIYSLDISLSKGYTGKYSQHSGNLISAKFLKSFPYVLSFDDKLNLRIWDFRTFQTIQIINCEKNFINPSKLQIIPQLSQCLICQKKITQFRAPALQKKSKQINQFYNIFDFKICSMTNNIYVFTSNDVRVYNYITGALMKVFTKLDQNAFQTNITAAQFGYKSRKFFLGDAGGFVRQFCSQTGDFLQQIKPTDDIQYENKAIVKIIFLKEHSLLVCCSQDGRIMIYERDSNSQFQIVRDIRQTHFQLTCAAASVRYCLLATGSDNGTVNVWNLQKFALQAVFALQNRIINIGFSPIHPIMFVVQETGIISFFYVRPFEDPTLRYTCFAKIKNIDQKGNIVKISSFSFDLIINAYFNKKCPLIKQVEGKHHLIFTIGHKNGTISVVNMNKLITKFQIQQNHQIFNTKKSIRCQIHNAKTLIANQRNKILLVYGFSNKNAEEIDIHNFNNFRSFSVTSSLNQQVDQMLLIKQNSIILSTCGDKRLKVWSLEGDLNGSIDFFTFKKINWKVSQINFHKKIQAIQTCIYSIKLIQNRKFSLKEEEGIKVNLLMNEFMDDKQKDEYLNWIRVINRTRCSKSNIRAKIKLQPKRQMESDCSDADEQILQEYYKNVIHNNFQKGCFEREAITKSQFDQIYTSLVHKIKSRIGSEKDLNLNNLSGSVSDINKALGKKIPVAITNQPHLIHIKKDRITTDKQMKQYERLFKKTMILKRPQVKKKVNNMLYQNLSQVRRKIQVMSSMRSKVKRII